MTTPIDPNDLDGLASAYVAAMAGERTVDDGVLAVARAVCPGHHAVYDTRTHRAVLMTDLRDLLLYADGGWGVEWDDIVDGAVDRTSRLLPEGWHPEDDEDRRSEWQATEKRCYESEVSR